MSPEIVAYSESRHPAPLRKKVGLASQFYGMFASPIAWAGNLMVTYGLVSHACYPGFQPLEHVVEGFGFVWPLVLALYVAALLICVSSFFVSHWVWRMTRTETQPEGHAHHLLERGGGRSRYFALIGMSVSVLFFVATLFGAVSVLLEPLCVR